MGPNVVQSLIEKLDGLGAHPGLISDQMLFEMKCSVLFQMKCFEHCFAKVNSSTNLSTYGSY